MSVLYRFTALLPAAGATAIPDAGLLERDGRIVAVGPFREVVAGAPATPVERIAGLALPGLVDAHSHLRGLPLVAQGLAPRPLEPWICSLAALTALDPGDEALLAATDLLATGVTTVQGIVHGFGAAESVVADALSVLDALTTAGIRALLVVGFTDRAERTPLPVPADLDAVPPIVRGTGPDDWPGMVDRLRKAVAGIPELDLGVGPVAAPWCSDAALAAIADARDGSRVHTHLDESVLHRDWVAGEASAAERLGSAGLLGGFSSVAHGVHLVAAEVAALVERGTTLVHCPGSNEVLSVGSADTVSWLAAGAGVALGLDSQGEGEPDMFQEMREAQRTAMRLGRTLGSREVLAMATEGGARATGVRAGRLEAGRLADICVVDAGLASEGGDVTERLVAEGSRKHVTDVVVGGVRRMRDGRVGAAGAAEAAAIRLRAAVAADSAPREARLRALEPALRQLTDYRGVPA